MIFEGIGRVFSTVNGQQYETIGAFWDELSEKYGRCRLRGLGFHWTENTIEYVIGLKEGRIDGADRSVSLPDEGWECVRGKTAQLGRLYETIYKDGSLQYEIESFTDEGSCEILYYR